MIDRSKEGKDESDNEDEGLNVEKYFFFFLKFISTIVPV
jgi:hypothetical protein